MGVSTPNIGLYLPANGEEVYGASFAVGMNYLDLHDHSGPPHGGVPLSASSLVPGSITGSLLGPTVISGGGLAQSGAGSIILTGPLPSLGGLGTNGIMVNNGVTVSTVSIVGDSSLTVNFGNGIGGSPQVTLNPVPNVTGLNANVSPLTFYIGSAPYAAITNTGGIANASRALVLNSNDINHTQMGVYTRVGQTGNLGAGAPTLIFTIGGDPYQVWMVFAFNLTNPSAEAYSTTVILVNTDLSAVNTFLQINSISSLLPLSDGGGGQVILTNGTAFLAKFAWTAIRLA